MEPLTFASFLLLSLSFLSLWIRRDPKIWASLLVVSLICAFWAGNILWIGLLFIALLATLWLFHAKRPLIITFIALTLTTLIFKLHFLPGFPPIPFTAKFHIGFSGALIGLFPLALLVPLSRTARDWKKVLQGFGLGCAGIGVLAILATLADVTHWDFKLPSFMIERSWSNLFLACIPEEGFYRGFLQRGLSRYFHETRKGHIAALLITSIIFTFAHIFWSPDVATLGFVFLASLLYGGVYIASGKIESAILTHFLLNLVHMTFFEYHAM